MFIQIRCFHSVGSPILSVKLSPFREQVDLPSSGSPPVVTNLFLDSEVVRTIPIFLRCLHHEQKILVDVAHLHEVRHSINVFYKKFDLVKN